MALRFFLIRLILPCAFISLPSNGVFADAMPSGADLFGLNALGQSMLPFVMQDIGLVNSSCHWFQGAPSSLAPCNLSELFAKKSNGNYRLNLPRPDLIKKLPRGDRLRVRSIINRIHLMFGDPVGGIGIGDYYDYAASFFDESLQRTPKELREERFAMVDFITRLGKDLRQYLKANYSDRELRYAAMGYYRISIEEANRIIDLEEKFGFDENSPQYKIATVSLYYSLLRLRLLDLRAEAGGDFVLDLHQVPIPISGKLLGDGTTEFAKTVGPELLREMGYDVWYDEGANSSIVDNFLYMHRHLGSSFSRGNYRSDLRFSISGHHTFEALRELLLFGMGLGYDYSIVVHQDVWDYFDSKRSSTEKFEIHVTNPVFGAKRDGTPYLKFPGHAKIFTPSEISRVGWEDGKQSTLFPDTPYQEILRACFEIASEFEPRRSSRVSRSPQDLNPNRSYRAISLQGVRTLKLTSGIKYEARIMVGIREDTGFMLSCYPIKY